MAFLLVVFSIVEDVGGDTEVEKDTKIFTS